MERGWLNSAFFWSYGLFQLVMGWVVDRYGVKWPYASASRCGARRRCPDRPGDTLSALIVMRLLIGAAEAIVMPASYRWMGNNFAESQKGTAVGLFTMGGKIGPAIGAPIAAWMIVNHSWQLMFIAPAWSACCGWSPGCACCATICRPGRSCRRQRRRRSSVSFGSLLSSPVVWGGLINNFCYGYFTFYCMTWMPAYLVEQRGLSLENSGLYTFFSFAGIAIVATAGWAADRFIARGHDAVPGAQVLRRRRLHRRHHRAARRLCAHAADGAVLERALAVAAGPGHRQQHWPCAS
jgi:ACS family D-galactonate transporter-like MFS transporter